MHQDLDSLNLFYQLKQDILAEYQKAYPYWKGSLKDFGNKEIAQLQDLIEENTKQRISEKWVYTHLKPEFNTKLPRQDMLDILSVWLGYSGWDEFKAKNEQLSNQTERQSLSKNKRLVLILMLTVFIVIVVIYRFGKGDDTKNVYSITFLDQYTQKIISEDNFSVFVLNDVDSLKKQKIDDGCLKLMHDSLQLQLKINSPYYKNDVFYVSSKDEENTIYLQPDDYAMMLLVYMNSNLKDWEKRRLQLEEIILDDAEIIEVMNEDIGIEFLNKEEFIDKITIPIESTKRMEIIDIKYKEKGRIIELKFIEKDKNEK